eukprot:326329_1
MDTNRKKLISVPEYETNTKKPCSWTGRKGTHYDKNGKYKMNPFIASCRFGRITTILKLLNYVQNIDDDKNTKLKTLLFENYTKKNGYNCLMVVFENKNWEIIYQILTFLKVNKFNDILLELLSMKTQNNKINGEVNETILHMLANFSANGCENVLVKIFEIVVDASLKSRKNIVDNNKHIWKLLNVEDSTGWSVGSTLGIPPNKKLMKSDVLNFFVC